MIYTAKVKATVEVSCRDKRNSELLSDKADTQLQHLRRGRAFFKFALMSREFVIKLQ